MKISDFRAVVNLWPTAAALAEDVNETYAVVRQWRKRNFIPARHWQRLLEAAKRRKIHHISPEKLIRLASDKRVQA